MTTIYRTSGALTGTIEPENVELAQAYLTEDDMTRYLDEPLRGVVERIQWHLNHDGHTYYVEAIANRDLTDDELAQLAAWVSGQNSDGLGEGFEQQDFAWVGEERDFFGDVVDEGAMCSFDWQTNDSKFERVSR